MNLPPLVRVALGLVGLSLILFLAGFGSSYWFVSASGSSYNFGLWVICKGSTCVSFDAILGGTPIHAYIGRVFTLYELIAVIITLVLMALFVFKSARQQFVKSSYSLLISGGVVGFLGAVVFLGREKSLDTDGSLSVSWSGILVIFAAIMQIVAGVLIFLPVSRGQVEFEQV